MYMNKIKNPNLLLAWIRTDSVFYKKGWDMKGVCMCLAIDELIEDGKAEGREEGRVEGRAEAVLDLLGALGTVAEELQKFILSQNETKVLQSWLYMAAKSESIDEFKQKANLNI